LCGFKSASFLADMDENSASSPRYFPLVDMLISLFAHNNGGGPMPPPTLYISRAILDIKQM
jgi:hypothetical protein